MCMFVCCFQFLYGSAHVMTQPGFHQACEVAFAECSGAVKDYIVEQEVLSSKLLFAFTTCVPLPLTCFSFQFLSQLQDFVQSAIPGWNEDEVTHFALVKYFSLFRCTAINILFTLVMTDGNWILVGPWSFSVIR